nr:MAG TPA: hypothetical protein [Caudoviricetes sp.]
MTGITWRVLDSYVGWCTIGLSPIGEWHRAERDGPMEFNRVVREATMNVFEILIDEGYSPKLEFEGNSLTLWTEDSSAETVVLINRKRAGFGEHVLSLQVIPGEGETYVAEMIADEIVNVIKGEDG